MKKSRAFISLLLALLLVMGLVMPAGASAAGYEITNPYGNVDFGTVNTYKAALHSHTNASDGDQTLYESLEMHSLTGFDIVATTDHGTVSRSWENVEANKLIHGVLSLVGRSKGDLVGTGKSGTFSNGESYTLTTENGDDYLVTSGGKRIMRVPFGIEQNAVSVNAHVNSWFADYHSDSITTYADAIKNVDRLGGLCVINHPGEYSKARYEIRSENAYNTNEFAYWYHVNKWAKLIDTYDSCIGIDINSKGDDRTRFDRILWDELLTRFSSDGKNVYAICSSDAHRLNVVNSGFVLALMPSLTSSALKSSLANGEFFGASHCIGNPDELDEIAVALKEFYGETELYTAVRTRADEMFRKADDIENGKEDADEDIGITYSVLDEGIYEGPEVTVTNIVVDDGADTITIESENALIVRWISDGRLVTSQKADSATINLNDYSDSIGNYIRAEIFGEGGVVYTQAFILNASQNAGNGHIVDKGFFDFGVFDFLVGVLANFGDILTRFFANLF